MPLIVVKFQSPALVCTWPHASPCTANPGTLPHPGRSWASRTLLPGPNWGRSSPAVRAGCSLAPALGSSQRWHLTRGEKLDEAQRGLWKTRGWGGELGKDLEQLYRITSHFFVNPANHIPSLGPRGREISVQQIGYGMNVLYVKWVLNSGVCTVRKRGGFPIY